MLNINVKLKIKRDNMKKFSKKKPLNSICIKSPNPLEDVKKQKRDYRHLPTNWQQELLSLPTEEKEMKMLLYSAQGHRNLVKMIYESSSEININCTYYEDNCLTLAARSGDFATVKYLIGKGIDINFVGADGKSALHTYSRKGMLNECRYLLDNQALADNEGAYGQPPIFDAVIENNTEIIELLYSYNADLDYQNDDDVAPIMVACQNKMRQESLLTLLKLGADIEVQDKNMQRPIGYAIKSNNRIFIDMLIKRNCKINYKDINGTTPLMLAAKYGQKETLRVLLSKGADVFAKDRKGRTAYDYAIKYNYQGSAEILKKAEKLVLEGEEDLSFFGKQNKVENSCVK